MSIASSQYGIYIEIQVLEKGVPVDVTTATAIVLKTRLPNRTEVSWTGESSTNPARPGSQGWVRYLLLLHDIDAPGDYRIQPQIDFGSTKHIAGDYVGLHVNAPFEKTPNA